MIFIENYYNRMVERETCKMQTTTLTVSKIAKYGTVLSFFPVKINLI